MKLFLFIALLAFSSLLGGVYGALYDQVTFSVCEEFFTKMRFEQYNIPETMSPRLAVALIGFINTWSTGLVLGFVLSLTGLLHVNERNMIKYTIQSFFIAFFTALLFGIIAYLVKDPTIMTPNSELNIVNKEGFNKVVNMNNYTYVGGIIGMFIGAGWQLYKTKQSIKN